MMTLLLVAVIAPPEKETKTTVQPLLLFVNVTTCPVCMAVTTLWATPERVVEFPVIVPSNVKPLSTAVTASVAVIVEAKAIRTASAVVVV
jgi:hypothetical protein